jgi:hypothetical protein
MEATTPIPFDIRSLNNKKLSGGTTQRTMNCSNITEEEDIQ